MENHAHISPAFLNHHSASKHPVGEATNVSDARLKSDHGQTLRLPVNSRCLAAGVRWIDSFDSIILVRCMYASHISLVQCPPVCVADGHGLALGMRRRTLLGKDKIRRRDEKTKRGTKRRRNVERRINCLKENLGVSRRTYL